MDTISEDELEHVTGATVEGLQAFAAAGLLRPTRPGGYSFAEALAAAVMCLCTLQFVKLERGAAIGRAVAAMFKREWLDAEKLILVVRPDGCLTVTTTYADLMRAIYDGEDPVLALNIKPIVRAFVRGPEGGRPQ